MKTTLILSIAFGLNCLEMEANTVVKDTIPYINGDCQQTDDFSQQNVSFRLQGDTLYMDGWLAANYCGEHYLAYEQWDDSIAIRVYDKYVDDVPCTVNCLYPVKAQIGNCSNEYYKINVQNHIVGNYEKNAIVKRQYQPVLVGDTVRWSFLGYFASDTPLEHVDVAAYGDTLINGLHYKHLGVDETNFFNESWGADENRVEEMNALWQNYTAKDAFKRYNYCIRESQDGAKIFVLNLETNEELLLSDLSLNEGDTFNGVETVISVKLEDGLKQVKVGDDLNIKETLGPDNWLFFPFDKFGMTSHLHYLNCFKNQNHFFTSIGAFLPLVPCGCDEPYFAKLEDVSGENFQTAIEDGILKISLEHEQNAHISLYNANGQPVLKTAMNSATIEIPLQNVQAGMYILRIINENRESIGTEKIAIR